MCRIAAYLGPSVPLADFLTAPAHGLARQSWDAREMVSATVNADGWGVGWYADDGAPAVYRHILPIWADGNVDALGRSLVREVWMANVRSATTGLGTDHANTQPFIGDGLIFLHNGFIEGFAHRIRAKIRAAIAPDVEETINGNTDSEYLFALLRSQPGEPAEKLEATRDLVRHWLADTPERTALLNMIVTDGRQLAAVRSAVNAAAPSLYINHDWQRARVVASEAFDRDPGWESLQPERLFRVSL